MAYNNDENNDDAWSLNQKTRPIYRASAKTGPTDLILEEVTKDNLLGIWRRIGLWKWSWITTRNRLQLGCMLLKSLYDIPYGEQDAVRAQFKGTVLETISVVQITFGRTNGGGIAVATKFATCMMLVIWKVHDNGPWGVKTDTVVRAQWRHRVDSTKMSLYTEPCCRNISRFERKKVPNHCICVLEPLGSILHRHHGMSQSLSLSITVFFHDVMCACETKQLSPDTFWLIKDQCTWSTRSEDIWHISIRNRICRRIMGKVKSDPNRMSLT